MKIGASGMNPPNPCSQHLSLHRYSPFRLLRWGVLSVFKATPSARVSDSFLWPSSSEIFFQPFSYPWSFFSLYHPLLPPPPRPHTHTRACSVIINSGCALVSLRTFLKILIPALPPPPPTPPFWFNREVPALVIFKAPEIILIVAKVKNHPFSIQFLKRSLRLLFVLSHLSFLYHCRLAFLSLKSTVTQ